jgi:hypothetical protein
MHNEMRLVIASGVREMQIETGGFAMRSKVCHRRSDRARSGYRTHATMGADIAHRARLAARLAQLDDERRPEISGKSRPSAAAPAPMRLMLRGSGVGRDLTPVSSLLLSETRQVRKLA